MLAAMLQSCRDQSGQSSPPWRSSARRIGLDQPLRRLEPRKRIQVDREATREASPKTRGLSWGPPPTTAIKEVSAGKPDESVALGVGLQAAALAGALRQPKMGTNRPLAKNFGPHADVVS